ncbi:hypothetical protein HYZ82_01930 [Candidatus Nomurabacteria bacterium]|nr:hypothetical protein [Candidatus Nomurabacteria bacterium]
MKQNILNWIGGIWLLFNLPIPMVGPAVFAILNTFFFYPEIPYVIFTFIVFVTFLVLSKKWSGKYIKVPVVLSLLIFLYATLVLEVVQDHLIRYRTTLLWIIFVVLVVVICIAVVKAMRGELNKKI